MLAHLTTKRPLFNGPLRLAAASAFYGAAKLRRRVGVAIIGACILTGGMAGCSSVAINPDADTTFLDSRDLIAMTDKMAAAMAASPVLAQLAAQNGPLIVVLTPLVNKTNSIITRGQGAAFLHRVRILLSSQPTLGSRFVFTLTRMEYSALKAQTLAAGAAPRGRLEPRYALQADFYAATNVAANVRSDYYLCTFYLTRITSGQIVWQGSYETRKVAHDSFLY